MPPFNDPTPIITSLKEKVECATALGDRLYLGTATGSLYVYGVDYEPAVGKEAATLVECKKNISRRAIEQVVFIKDVNSVAILSDSTVTLLPLPSFAPPTPLVKAKGALSFAVNTSIQHLQPDGRPVDSDAGKSPKAIPTLITQLVIGCRRRVVIYSWRDGDAQDTKELALPHSPRAMAFLKQSPGGLNDALPTTSTMKSSQLGRNDGRAVSAALALDEVAVVVTWRMEIVVVAGRACLPSPRGIVFDKQALLKRKVLIQARVSLDVWASVDPTVPHRHRHLFQSFHFRRAGREEAYCRPLIIATEPTNIVLNAPPPTYKMKSVTTCEAIDRRSASGVIAGNAWVVDLDGLTTMSIAVLRAASCGIQVQDQAVSYHRLVPFGCGHRRRALPCEKSLPCALHSTRLAFNIGQAPMHSTLGHPYALHFARPGFRRLSSSLSTTFDLRRPFRVPPHPCKLEASSTSVRFRSGRCPTVFRTRPSFRPSTRALKQ